jgi:ABC-type phosphate transport system substrate-binding protein
MHRRSTSALRPHAVLALLLVSIVTTAPISSHAADVVVIAGNTSGITTLTKEQVIDLYLGRTTSLPGGGGASLLDQPESSPLRDAFYSKVTGKSAAQAKSTWAKLSFTGKGTPPKEGGSNDDIKRLVSSNKNTLGYIDKSAVDGSVKVVYAP